MTFPTAEQQASFASWLHLTGIASSIGSARPDLAEAVQVQDERTLHLTIDLPHAPGECQTKVVVAEVVMGIVRQWMVGAPGNPVISTFWTLGTSTDVLAEAALQSWDCSVAGVPLPSPWKWSESERSEAVDLADRLVAEGLPVTAVAAMNPVVTRELADGPAPGCVDLRQGEVVRVAFGDTEAHLRLTPGAGWTIEADALTPQDRASLTSTIATLTGARL